MTISSGSVYLSPDDVARRLQVHSETIREYLRTGKIKGIHVARKWRITEEALAEFLNTLAAGDK
jgi:excisionase family DNA binding protein